MCQETSHEGTPRFGGSRERPFKGEEHQGKVFALTRGGVLYYPRYAFDEVLDPRPVVGEVLSVLARCSPYRLASWFESTNSCLGGGRPRERLSREPEAVVAAARDHRIGPTHG